MSKEYKAAKYVQEKIIPYVANAVRAEEPCFTKEDLRKAFEAGWDDAIQHTKRDYSDFDRNDRMGRIIKS